MSVPPERPPVYPPPGAPVDQPTAPLDPVADRGVPHAYRTDPYAADARQTFWRLESLRTALTVVGLLALIAIGLAVWALIRANHNNGRTSSGVPANTAAVIALNRRVSNLEASMRTLRTSGGTHLATAQSLAARIAALQQSEKQLASQVGHGGSSAQVSQLANKYSALSAKVSQWVGKEAALSGKVSGLQGRVSQLAGQVSQLKAQSSGQTTTTGTSTGP